MVALSLCRVASAQINILSVIVFPQEPQSLKSIYFFLWHFKMKYRSVSYISLLQFPKHFCTIFKVGVKVAFAKKRKKKLQVTVNHFLGGAHFKQTSGLKTKEFTWRDVNMQGGG